MNDKNEATCDRVNIQTRQFAGAQSFCGSEMQITVIFHKLTPDEIS
jgi:hypothetical protein